jgi:hypothetical protein
MAPVQPTAERRPAFDDHRVEPEAKSAMVPRVWAWGHRSPLHFQPSWADKRLSSPSTRPDQC